PVAFFLVRSPLEGLSSFSFLQDRPMPTDASGKTAPPAGPRTGLRAKVLRGLRAAMEALVLALVCLSPWAFGAVEPVSEFILYAGVALLVGLWGAKVLLEWRLSWQRCPVALCLAGLFLIGIWQLTPLPRPLLGRLSPATTRLYGRLLPV